MADTIAARKAPNPWWVTVVCGMASYIHAATIVATGIALVLYQQTIGVTQTTKASRSTRRCRRVRDHDRGALGFDAPPMA